MTTAVKDFYERFAHAVPVAAQHSMFDAHAWCEEHFGPEDMSFNGAYQGYYTGVWRQVMDTLFFIDQNNAFEFKMVWG